MTDRHGLRLPPLPDVGEAAWGRLYGSAASLTLATAASVHAAPVLLVTEDVREAERAETELRCYAPSGLEILAFPDWETLPYDRFSPHADIVSRRLATLDLLPTLERGILVVAAPVLLQRLPPPSYVTAGTFMTRVGERLDLDAWRRRLDTAGYRHVGQVMEPGEFAIRGSLIDLFPTGADTPLRIDLFDDEIESIRAFDPESQRSGDGVAQIRILPAREYPTDEPGIRTFRRAFRQAFEGDPTRTRLYREVSDGVAAAGLEYFLALYFEDTTCLLDYLPAGTVLASTTDTGAALTRQWAEIADRYEQRNADIEYPLLAPPAAFHPPEEVLERTTRLPTLRLESRELPDGINLPFRAPPRIGIDPRAEEPGEALAAFITGSTGRVLLVAESAGQREALLDLLRGRGVRPERVTSCREFLDGAAPLAVSVAALERGLLADEPALAVVVEEQLYGRRAKAVTRTRRRARDPQAIIRDLTDLRSGSPVVHEEYGVGRFVGLETLEVAGQNGEFLTLEYAGGDKLYVPVAGLDLISRYTGAAPEAAPLHRLGSDQWQKARRRAAEKIRDAAAELLDVYARREARRGRSFNFDEADYRAFAQAFPFEETVDQTVTIEAVIADLRSDRPMDRLVCGDVGFGKTEVALRAAFAAVTGGGQVAVLVPTTLLAQQHAQTFRDRFADWPVNIELLSRFRTQREATEVIAGLATGTVDIVIGTHRLLQRNVVFKDLGLVIIDEEHRFGVRHKERLRALRAEVDTLILTATPIPRTLNMAMGGLRELSLITTPPAERLAVKTFVSEWDDALLREAFLRELRRGGQVFFVHNTVKTIDKIAAKVAALVPEADLRVAHGQMRERELEEVMLDFYHRRFNVLVCTTIIESGIDISTANTIIIDRADKLGLAQLHQLRGRVGRSHHRAYAYLLTPPRQALSADAVKRLEAVESAEDLGAGFTLATHDLEIRGAGEVLGDEQSGQIQEIGFALYVELLERAVAALRRGEDPDLERPLHHGPEIDIHTPALLPDDYLPDVHLRLVLYKRIASAADDSILRDLQVEMIDRFGLLPEPARRLFELARLRLRAAPLGVSRIVVGARGGHVEFGAETPVDPAVLIGLVQHEPSVYRLDGPNRLRFGGAFATAEERLAAAAELLDLLAAPAGVNS